MRIVVEFQYSDRNYTRFISHNGVGFTNDRIAIETYIFHESDAKNQPLQQDLNNDQKEVLSNAGVENIENLKPLHLLKTRLCNIECIISRKVEVFVFMY